MSTAHPIIEDPRLGLLHRAETTLDDGDVVTHDWYAGTLTIGDDEIEVLIDGIDADAVSALIPRVQGITTDLHSIRRRASDAIITRFSDGEPSPADLDEGAADLTLDTIEATDDTTILHFTDACGRHFPDGFWPAVHLDVDGQVTDVTVES